MKPMSEAPRDRPFLAKMTAIGRHNSYVVFCQFRPSAFGLTTDQLNDPASPRWDIDGPVFFNDSHFEGWIDLPEGFENPRFRDRNI